MRVSRNKLMFGFAVMASMAMLSSAAFACTVFRGQSHVSGSGGQPSHAVGDARFGMAWCTNPTGTATVVAGSATAVTFVASPKTTNGPRGCPKSQIQAANDWRLTTLPGDWAVTRSQDEDCMIPNGGGTVTPIDISTGNYSTNASGNGTAVSAPYAFPAGSNMVCMSHANYADNPPMNKIVAI